MSIRVNVLTNGVAIIVGLVYTPLVWLLVYLAGWMVLDIVKSPPIVTTPAPSAIKVDLADLLKANAKNPIATLATYKGQVIETEGYVERIETTGSMSSINLVVSRTDHYLSSNHMEISFYPALARTLKDHDVKSRVRVRLSLDKSSPWLKATAQSIESAPQ